MFDYGLSDSILPKKSFTSWTDILFSWRILLHRVGSSYIRTYVHT
jgi:hypothetical protein